MNSQIAVADPLALERALALEQLNEVRQKVLAASAELDFVLDQVRSADVGEWSGAAAQAWRARLSELDRQGAAAGRRLTDLVAAVDVVRAEVER